VLIIETDPINKLGARFRESEGSKTVARRSIDCQDLSKAAAPDSAEELEGDAQIFLVRFPIDEDHDSRWTDANVEDSLGHLPYNPQSSVGLRRVHGQSG
jgi:hypothetical protein